MKIDIWSDFACPFCYIGKKKLEDVLAQFPQKEEVEIEFRSYQLNPNTPPYSGQDFYESMALKFGSVEKAKQMTASITEHAKSVGLDFNFDTMKPTNTFDAHRLTKFAKVHGKELVVTEKLLYANFTDSKDIGNTEVLTEIAVDAGLDKQETMTVLEDKNKYAGQVHYDIAKAQQLRIRSVPTFIFNDKYSLSGAQPTKVFSQVLNQVYEEQSKATIQNLDPRSQSDDGCGDDGCSI